MSRNYHLPEKHTKEKTKTKREKIKELLTGEHTIREIAKEVPCDINYVYDTKTRLLQSGEIDKKTFHNYKKTRKTNKGIPIHNKPQNFRKCYSTEEDLVIILLQEKYKLPFRDIGEYIGRTESGVMGRYVQIKKNGVSRYNEAYYAKLEAL